MKKTIVGIISLLLVVMLSVGLFAACNPTTDDPAGETESLLGVTDTEIWVGNTAGVTGALETIGAPFNLGIEAAFAAYNAQGGFNGKSVRLKNLDDGGDSTKSLSLMEQLIFEDEVFAIVGNFGSYAVNVNLDTLKEEKVPMIYAAAGNDSLYNANADTAEEKVIFPVQPLNVTEGNSLIARAFAAAAMPDANSATGYALTGGLGATKVGVIANNNEASKSLLQGIREEANRLPEAKKNAIVYQEVAGSDFSAAANALVAAQCDLIIVTTIGADYMAALTALSNANYVGNVLTSYNNASAAVFNDATTKLITAQGAEILSKMVIYTQGWIDISSTTYVYNPEGGSALLNEYKALDTLLGTSLYANGVAGFNEEYWGIAENIYNYAIAAGKGAATAFAMSYDSYALAGYIAGDLFCQGLKELQAAGKDLTRANYVEIMETKAFHIALGDSINYQGGARKGVEAFGLSMMYNYNGAATSVSTGTGLASIETLRGLIA